MVQKQKIYYARTYRHLVQSVLKNVLYLLLIVLPVLLLYWWKLHDITRFLAETGAKILGRIFPGCPIGISSVTYPVFGTVEYLTMPTVLPGFPFTLGNLAVTFAVLLILSTGKQKGHPIAIYLMLSLMTHVVSCTFFLFGRNSFPYRMTDFSLLYVSQQISIWLIFILMTGLITGFVGSRGYLYKILTFFATLAYSFVFGSVRYVTFMFLLERYSMLYMAIMFFVFGPLFDFLYLVWIYSFFINKMIKYYDSGKGRDEWRWS